MRWNKKKGEEEEEKKKNEEKGGEIEGKKGKKENKGVGKEKEKIHVYTRESSRNPKSNRTQSATA
jgi:hypothetical protein